MFVVCSVLGIKKFGVIQKILGPTPMKPLTAAHFNSPLWPILQKSKNKTKHEILFFQWQALFNLARERSCIILLSTLHKAFDTTTMVSLRLWMPWKSWFSVLMFILLYSYRSGKHKQDRRLFTREGVAQCVCCEVNHNVAINYTFVDCTSCLLLSGKLWRESSVTLRSMQRKELGARFNVRGLILILEMSEIEMRDKKFPRVSTCKQSGLKFISLISQIYLWLTAFQNHVSQRQIQSVEMSTL